MKELGIDELQLVQGGILPVAIGVATTSMIRGAAVGVTSYGIKETFGNQNYNWKDAGAAAIGGATGALIGNSNAIRTASSVFFSSAAEGLFYSISKSINQSGSDYGDGCDYQ